MPQLDIFILYSQIITTSILFIISYILIVKRYLWRITTILKLRNYKIFINYKHVLIISRNIRRSRRKYMWPTRVFYTKFEQRLPQLINNFKNYEINSMFINYLKYRNFLNSYIGFLKTKIILELSKEVN